MKKKVKKNYVALVVDDSGSMGQWRQETVDAFNGIIKEINAQAKKTGIDTFIQTTLFGSRVNTGSMESSDAARLTGYTASQGTTRLYDALVSAIKEAAKWDDGRCTFLVYALTDGADNASTWENKNGVFKSLLSEKQGTDRWTFGFHVPNDDAARRLEYFGVPKGNIRVWELSARGMVETRRMSDVSTQSFYGGLTRGETKSTALFTPDLSKLNMKKVVAKLTDLSNQFKGYEVAAEARVDEFVSKKTRKPYVIGQAYYMLMKAEKVQPDKAILLQEKGKAAVWGGVEARKLINMTEGVDVKVTPGNHANFDIYVQSCSINRKLPRGTKLLIDTQQTVALKPTWDHTAEPPKAAPAKKEPKKNATKRPGTRTTTRRAVPKAATKHKPVAKPATKRAVGRKPVKPTVKPKRATGARRATAGAGARAR